jgi:hypothetical protein
MAASSTNQAGLAGSPGSGEGDEALLRYQLSQFVDFPLAPDDRIGRIRQGNSTRRGRFRAFTIEHIQAAQDLFSGLLGTQLVQGHVLKPSQVVLQSPGELHLLHEDRNEPLLSTGGVRDLAEHFLRCA